MALMRLDKFLADLGVASRKELRDIIRAGRVSVDGTVIKKPEQKVDPETQSLTLDGEKHVLDNYNLPATQYTDVSVAVSDLYKTTTNTIRIPTSNFAIHLSSDGTSIAFGKAVEHTNSFEIDGGRTVYIGSKTLSQYSQVLQITSNAFSSLPVTISNSKITSDMVVIQYVLSNPGAQTSDWDWTTADGSIALSGTISGSTTITLYLAEAFT